MEIKMVDTTDTMVVRLTTPVSELSTIMGRVYGAIWGRLQSQGLVSSGPPFALYHNMDMEALDVEIGFPIAPGDVEKARAATGQVGPDAVTLGTIPGGRVVTDIHTGSYETIGATYEAMSAYVGEQGLQPADWVYEFYLNSPQDTAPEDLKTEIRFPVVD